MKPSPLQLEFFYVESLRWKVEPGFDPDNTVPLQVDDLTDELERAEHDQLREAAYRLTLKLPPLKGKFPYSFDITLVGFFSVTEIVPEERINTVFDANAPAVLYSAAREVMAATLGRGPFRPLLLPAVHFLDLLPPPQEPPAKVSHSAQLPAARAKARRASKKKAPV